MPFTGMAKLFKMCTNTNFHADHRAYLHRCIARIIQSRPYGGMAPSLTFHQHVRVQVGLEVLMEACERGHYLEPVSCRCTSLLADSSL